MEVDLKDLMRKGKLIVQDLLNFGPRAMIGLDIGIGSVKVAEISGSIDSGYVLEKYASVPLAEGAIIEDEIQNIDVVVDAIKEAVALAKMDSSSVCLSLSGPNTVTRKLQLAGGSDEELEDQVGWEAEQYLPFDIDESSVSYYVVGENEGGGVDVIIAAARKEVISNYKNLVEQADLRAKVVDLALVAVTNVFEVVMKDKISDRDDSWLIVDLGAQKTGIIIYKNNTIAFAKEISVGGLMITEEIQRQMGVSYFEAEDLKITGDDKGNLPEEIVEIIDDVVEVFFSEIKKTIDFYKTSTSDENFGGCVVTGGSALIPGILEGLEALIGIEIDVLNPFDKIAFNPKNIKESEINGIAYMGVQAIGLALRRA